MRFAFAILLPLAVMISCSGPKPAKVIESSKPDIEDPRVVETAAVRRLVLDALKDPGSAQFRNVMRRPGWGQPGIMGPMGAYCGEVNAKNAYGGYPGFKKFAVTVPLKADTKVDFEDEFNLPFAWEVFCKDMAGVSVNIENGPSN